MLRRALLGLLPALLALTLLSGAPAAGARDGIVAASSADLGGAFVSRGALHDDADFLQIQWGDQDDTPDPALPAREAFDWIAAPAPPEPPGTAGHARPTHRVCAARPRAPPSA